MNSGGIESFETGIRGLAYGFASSGKSLVVRYLGKSIGAGWEEFISLGIANAGCFATF